MFSGSNLHNRFAKERPTKNQGADLGENGKAEEGNGGDGGDQR